MENTFEELLQMVIGESNKNFINAEEIDFKGMRNSSCDEFLQDEDDGTYYDVGEELTVEAMLKGPQLVHGIIANSACESVGVRRQHEGGVWDAE